MKLNINSKLLLYIISMSFIIFIITIGYIEYNSNKMAYNDAKNMAVKTAKEYSAKIEKELNSDLMVTRTLSEAFLVYEDFTNDEWLKLFTKIYHNVFITHPNYYAIWDSWELNKIDSTYTKPYGRIINTTWREGSVIKQDTLIKSLNGDAELYAAVKKRAKQTIWEPYYDVFTEGKTERKYMTSLLSPIKKDGEYIGLVGIDLVVDRFQELVNEIHPFDQSYAFLISNGGIIIGHPNSNVIGKTIEEYMPKLNKEFKILDNIKEGKGFSYSSINENKEKYFTVFSPIVIGETGTPWAIGITVPKKVILKQANKNLYVSIIVGFIGLIILSIVTWLISKSITKPIIKTTTILKKIAKGIISNDNQLNIKTKDELGEMAESVNTLIEGLNQTANFAAEIGKGKLDAKFDLLSEEDVLGNALLEMQKSLIHAEKEDELRKIEDERQNWTTVGIAKFAEILRQNNDNIETLSFNIMSNLINYLDANQGALYVINDNNKEDIYYEMTASIAYGREKLIRKKVKVGEELVGRCIHEKLTIYMVDVPENYVNITSGLGEANPRCILLVPLKLNDDVYGVIEIVSFKNLEKFEIEFVEKLGESIASTISSVKINERTAQLLEQSQQQSEELAAQEEEMRQNMEELQATQEEAAKRENEMRSILNAINTITLMAEFDMDGKFIEINDGLMQLFGLPRENIIGRYQGDFDAKDDGDKEKRQKLWEDLRAGITRKMIQHIEVEGKDIWLSEAYTPVLDNEGKPYKVLNLAVDISEGMKNVNK
ncbi:MAG: GAF domain-containing protein [Chlorobi bacterium]|nr:GAF domain-containing protein [Chlorobiota bacterium]